MINFIEVKGTDYEMGFQIGQYFKEYLNSIISDYKKKLQNAYSQVKNMESKLKTLFPNLLDEIYGRADGANVSREALLLMFFPEIYKKIDGCTTCIVKRKNQVLFAHNEDNVNFTLNNVAIIKYNYGDRWIIAYTRAERLAGSAFSFNSNGIIYSSNYVFGEELNLDNLSRYIVVREVINSKSVKEAKQKLKQYDVASAFSLNILDYNTKEVVNVEKDVHECYITEISERYARSNHFHAKAHDESKDPESSKFRYAKTNELINKLDINRCTIDDLIKILQFRTDDYYKCVYKDFRKFDNKSVTNATFYLDTQNEKIFILDYMGNSKLTFNINGELLSQTEENLKLN